MTLAQIFAKVLNMSLTASLVIVLVIAARFILRKSPKVFSYALWAVVLFRLLCPVSLPSPVSLLGLLDAPVAESDGITSSVEYVPTNAGGYREIIVQNPVRTEIPDVPVLVRLRVTFILWTTLIQPSLQACFPPRYIFPLIACKADAIHHCP